MGSPGYSLGTSPQAHWVTSRRPRSPVHQSGRPTFRCGCPRQRPAAGRLLKSHCNSQRPSQRSHRSGQRPTCRQTDRDRHHGSYPIRPSHSSHQPPAHPSRSNSQPRPNHSIGKQQKPRQPQTHSRPPPPRWQQILLRSQLRSSHRQRPCPNDQRPSAWRLPASGVPVKPCSLSGWPLEPTPAPTAQISPCSRRP